MMPSLQAKHTRYSTHHSHSGVLIDDHSRFLDEQLWRCLVGASWDETGFGEFWCLIQSLLFIEEMIS